MRFIARLACAFLFASCAQGLNLGDASPSYDGVFYVFTFPNGDKPVPGCSAPSGWTEADKGTGGGEICDQGSNEWDFAVQGTSAQNDFHYAYKSAGTGDFQIKARFTDVYAGATANFAGLGLTASDGTADSDFFFNCFSPRSTSYAIRMLYGTPGGTITSANGSNGTTRPRYAAITYDDSQTDVRCWSSADGSTWLQVGQASHDFGATPVAGVYGQSGNAAETLSATADNIAFATTIDVYTPSGGGGGGPTLVSQIENQSGLQGASFALDCSANFSGATSYSIPANGAAGGLASGTGISFDTAACDFSGTFTASDVGVRNITVTAANGSGTTDATFQLTVFTSSGDLFTIPDVGDSTASTFNCGSASGANGATWSSIRTSGSGSTPGAGDTIQITGGTRGPTTFQNCSGSNAAPLTIKNRTSDSVPATIRYAGSGSFALKLTGTTTNVVIDGTGKFSGADSGTLGVTSGTHAEGRTQAGIVVTKTGATQPSTYFHITGFSCIDSDSAPGGCVIKGVKVDAVANTGGTGICWQMNDHTVKAASNPGIYRKITLQNNYGAFCGAEGEGFYIGPNQGELDVPLRNVKVNYNLIDDSGRECVNVKNVMDGDNEMVGNHCYRPGLPQGTSQNDAFNINTAASWRFADNRAFGPGGNCLQVTYQNVSGSDTANPASVIDIENNMLVGCGKNTGSYYGFSLNGSATPSSVTARIRNNTVAGAKTGAINASGRFTTSTCSSANNIFADNGASNIVSGCAEANNRKGTIASQNFVNGSTASGSQGASASGDFHLKATSPACGNSNANHPDTDYDGDSRPTNGADQGADESAACP